MVKLLRRTNVLPLSKSELTKLKAFMEMNGLTYSCLEAYFGLPVSSFSHGKKNRNFLTPEQKGKILQLVSDDSSPEVQNEIENLLGFSEELKSISSENKSGESVEVTEKDVEGLRMLISRYGNISRIPRKYGISPKTYRNILNGKEFMRLEVIEKLREAIAKETKNQPVVKSSQSSDEKSKVTEVIKPAKAEKKLPSNDFTDGNKTVRKFNDRKKGRRKGEMNEGSVKKRIESEDVDPSIMNRKNDFKGCAFDLFMKQKEKFESANELKRKVDVRNRLHGDEYDPARDDVDLIEGFDKNLTDDECDLLEKGRVELESMYRDELKPEAVKAHEGYGSMASGVSSTGKASPWMPRTFHEAMSILKQRLDNNPDMDEILEMIKDMAKAY